MDDSKRNLSSIQSDLSSFKISTADQQSSIFSSIENINSALIDIIKGNNRLELSIIETDRELTALKDELKNQSNKANATDSKSRAAD